MLLGREARRRHSREGVEFVNEVRLVEMAVVLPRIGEMRVKSREA